MPQYFYPADVFACVVDGTAIFLKLKADQYLGLDAIRSELFQRLLQSDHDSSTETLAAELIARDLVTARADSRRPLLCSSIPLPHTTLLDPVYEDPPKVTAGNFVTFLSACLAVHVALRRGSTYRALHRFARSQARLQGKAAAIDLGGTRHLVKVFRHLRPIIYGAFDNCLYDSLVLGDFLGRYGVRSSCVLGVRTMPFEAHCWLEIDGSVVNGVPEMIKRFTPILAMS